MDRAEYIAHGADSVAGWFRPSDRHLFAAIDDAQRRDGITGDLLEIGCYQGTSAILMGYMKQDHERMIVCDIFDGATETDEDLKERERYYTPNFGRQMFEDNYRRFHGGLPEIVHGPSWTLAACDFEPHSMRFIHVDGSHAYDQVRGDLAIARQLLAPGGVIAMDDLLSPHSPGVTAATWEAVAVDSLIPMFQSGVKFYGSWDTPINIDLPAGLGAVHHTVRGHHMLNIEG